MDWPSSNINMHPEWEEGMPNEDLGCSCMFVSNGVYGVSTSLFASCSHSTCTVVCEQYPGGCRLHTDVHVYLHIYWKSLGPAAVWTYTTAEKPSQMSLCLARHREMQ